jgi:hypothetical protein
MNQNQMSGGMTNSPLINQVQFGMNQNRGMGWQGQMMPDGGMMGVHQMGQYNPYNNQMYANPNGQNSYYGYKKPGGYQGFPNRGRG